MVKMKKFRPIAVFLTVLLLFAGSLQVNAASGEAVLQNGVTAQLITDKESYNANEAVWATVKVDNATGKAIEVSCTITAPEGVILADGNTVFKGVIEPGAGWTTAVDSNVSGSSAAEDTKTSSPVLWIILALMACVAIVVASVLLKKKKTAVSVLVGFAIVGSLMASKVSLKAEDDTSGVIDVSCVVSYDSKEAEIKASVTYTILEDADNSAETAAVNADGWFTGNQKEYTLNTAEDLLLFQELRAEGETFDGITIKLGSDIRINEGTAAEIKASGDENKLWAILESGNEFRGIFDGQGHTVSGIYMKGTDKANFGMFGTLGGDAVIKDFTLNDSYFVGPENSKKVMGAIASELWDKADVTISNVSSNVLMEEKGKLSYVGGILGQINRPATLTMKDCTFDGSIIISGDGAGGMVGYISHSKAKVTIKNCVNNGTVSAGTNAGDIIGWLNKGTIKLENCSGTNDSKDNLIGGASAENIQKKTLKIAVDGEAVKNVASEAAGGKGDITWYTGDKTEYVITTAEELLGFAELRLNNVSFDNVTIKLGNDITLNEGNSFEIRERGKKNTAWKLLASDNEFLGVFDGQNHTISGMYLQMKGSGSKSIFGAMGDGSVVKNLKVVNSYFGGPGEEKKHTLGAIASQAIGTVLISNVHVDAIMEEQYGIPFNWVGGLVGRVNAKTNLTMENCSMTGSIAISGDGAGGMIGYVSHSKAKVQLVNCTSTAQISGGSSGDLLGFVNKGTLSVTNSSGADGKKDNLVGRTATLGGIELVVDNETVLPVYVDPGTPPEPTTDTSWFLNIGTETTPEECILTDAKDLLGLNELQNDGENFEYTIIKLGNDITLPDGTVWPGLASSKTFAGTFDGQGYTISGVHMALKSSGNKGMFATLADGAVLTDFTLADSSFVGTTASSTKSNFGMLASTASGVVTISKVTIADTVAMTEYVDGSGNAAKMTNMAGFIGSITTTADTKVTIEDCVFKGTITNSYRLSSGFVGAVTVKAAGAEPVLTIKNCEFAGTINSVDRYAAGFIARVTDDASAAGTAVIKADGNRFKGTITTKTIAEGAAADDTTYAGGFIGDVNTASKVNIENFSYDGGQIVAAGKHAGGVIGAVTGDGMVNLTTCSLTSGTVSAGSNAGDMVGYAAKGDIMVKGCKGTNNNSNFVAALDADNASLTSVYSSALGADTAWYNDSDSTFTLYTAEQLMGFHDLLSSDVFSGKTVKLDCSMVINEGDTAAVKANTANNISWTKPSKNFAGTFDGQNHRISGLYMNVENAEAGMFGVLGVGAVLKDFTLENSYYLASKSKEYVGALAGRMAGNGTVTISGVMVNALLEEASGVTMNNVGGFIGGVKNSNAVLNIENSEFRGNIKISGANAGGFVGHINKDTAKVTVTEGINSGTVAVAANGNAGAIIGYAQDYTEVTLSECEDKTVKLNLIGKDEKGSASSGTAYAVTDWFTGAANATYTLDTAEKLAGFNVLLASGEDFEGDTIELTASVTINTGSASELKAAGAGNTYTWAESDSAVFKGTFDGRGNTISGIYMPTTLAAQGIFGTLGDGAAVKNVTIDKSYFGGPADTELIGFGVLAGKAAGTVNISSVIVGSDVALEGKNSKSGWHHIGGLIGDISESCTLNVADCKFEGSITAWKNTGGIIGYIDKNISELTLNITSCSTGNIAVTGANTGALIGYVASNGVTISGCSGQMITAVGTIAKNITVTGSTDGYSCVSAAALNLEEEFTETTEATEETAVTPEVAEESDATEEIKEESVQAPAEEQLPDLEPAA